MKQYRLIHKDQAFEIIIDKSSREVVVRHIESNYIKVFEYYLVSNTMEMLREYMQVTLEEMK